MATVLGFIAAVLPRLLFIGHGIICLFLLLEFNPGQTIYWATCLSLGCLFLESIYTVIVRKGKEYKYFWPSCFFYLCTLLPITWFAELQLLDDRLEGRTESRGITVGGYTIKQESLKKFCEIGLILLIILGRWMLPRGSITRDQLSVLLLEYVAIAADILELFEAFDDEQVALNKTITVTTLGAFSWSLLQFTFVTAAVKGGNDEVEENEYEEKQKTNGGKSLTLSQAEKGLPRRYLRKAAEARKREKRRQELYELKSRNDEADAEMRRLELQGDKFGILAAIFMQDGPFLVLRLFLVIKYDFFNDSNFLFYIGKNFISLIFMFYRLYVIQFHAKEEEIAIETPTKRSRKFRTLSLFMVGAGRLRLGNK